MMLQYNLWAGGRTMEQEELWLLLCKGNSDSSCIHGSLPHPNSSLEVPVSKGRYLEKSPSPLEPVNRDLKMLPIFRNYCNLRPRLLVQDSSRRRIFLVVAPLGSNSLFQNFCHSCIIDILQKSFSSVLHHKPSQHKTS